VRALDGVGVRKTSTETRLRDHAYLVLRHQACSLTARVVPWESVENCRFQMTDEGFEICNFHLMGL